MTCCSLLLAALVAAPSPALPPSPPNIDALAGAVATQPAPLHHHRQDAVHPWRLMLSGGGQTRYGRHVEWLGNPTGSEWTVRLQRDLPWLTGLGAGLALNYRAASDSIVTLQLVEAQLGATWRYPAAGIGGWLFPYVRAALLFGWTSTQAQSLSGDAFVPGLLAGLGLRATFGKARRGGISRVFVVLEGDYAGRLPTTLRLHAQLAAGEPKPKTNAATPLGRVNLSSYSWRFGVGLAF